MDKFNRVGGKVTYVPFSKRPSKGYSDDKERKSASILESLYWQAIGGVHTPSFVNRKLESDSKTVIPKSSIECERYKFHTKKSFAPKLQIEDKVPYGVLPRDVVSDIEKRRYGQQDFKSILNEMGIQKEAILPQTLYYNDRIEILKKQDSEGIPLQPFLELNTFDDAWYYDAYSPEERFRLGDNECGRKPLPAVAFIPVQKSGTAQCLDFDWDKVMVSDYDSEKKLYRVRRVLDNQDEKNPFHDNDNLEDMWIPRIYLKFDSEEPLQFAKRLQTALYTRRITEESLRTSYYVECMPTEGSPEFSTEDIDDIIGIARSSRPLQEKSQGMEDRLIKNIDELQVEYKRAYNYMCYMEITNQTPCLIKDFKNDNLFADDKNIYLKEQTSFSFTERLESFRCKTFFTSVEAIHALNSVEESILSLHGMSLYNLSLNDIQTLERFEATQKTQLLNISKYLYETWMPEISNAISLNMKNCGKGQYDLNQTVIHTFKLTKLGKLLKMVVFKMQDVLRYLVIESLEKYVSLFQTAYLNVKDIEDNFKWTESLSSNKFSPPKNPVFEVPLEIKEDHLRFVISLKKYEETIKKLFDEGLRITKNLPNIDKFVMKKMLYNPDDKLNTVGEEETLIVRWKKDIDHGMKKSILAATAYIRAYDVLLKSFKIDQINYVKELARKKATFDQLKQVIEMHNTEKLNLQNTIPSYVDIGPFRLITITVRETAIKKHEQLVNATLDYFYAELRKFMENINEEFLKLHQTIDQPTGNIEDLVEKKQWCRTVPKEIEKLCVLVNRLRSDVKFISTFNRNMDDQDVNTFWQMQKFPQGTMKKLQNRISVFEKEKREHSEHLRSDQETLESNLQMLQQIILGFTHHSELEKMSIIATEVRKARKSLVIFDEQSQLYQKREKLFGLPITDYPQIAVLSEALLPYENFWLSAAEFNKYKERDDADLSTVDSSQLQQAIEKFRSNLQESLEFFKKGSYPKIHESVTAILKDVDDFIATRLPKFKFQN